MISKSEILIKICKKFNAETQALIILYAFLFSPGYFRLMEPDKYKT